MLLKPLVPGRSPGSWFPLLASESDHSAKGLPRVKQRKDSIEQFDKGGRADLSEIEKKELLVLDKYMPEMMSEEAINELVTKTISELGAAGPQDMGKVMGHLKGSVGDSADMGLVSKIVKEKLI